MQIRILTSQIVQLCEVALHEIASYKCFLTETLRLVICVAISGIVKNLKKHLKILTI